MKVILKKDVKGIGRANDAVTTADGYALNYLIPKHLAVVATVGAVKEAELRQKQVSERKDIKDQILAQNMISLAEAKIVIKVRANEKGHLYDAVGKPEIAKAAKECAHIDLPEDVIKLEKPIRELGTFEVPVATGEIFGKFSVTIEAE